MGIDDGVSHLEEQSREAVPVPSDPEVTHSAFVAEQSVEFIEDHADGGPFLCVAGFYPPHSVPRADHPWMAPREYLDLYDPEELTLPEFPPEAEAERTDGQFDEETRRRRGPRLHADRGTGRVVPGRRRPGPPDQALLSVPRSRAVAVRRFFTTAPDLPEMFPEEPRSGRPRTGAER